MKTHIKILLITVLFPLTLISQHHDEDDKRFCFEPVTGSYYMSHVYKGATDIYENTNQVGFKFGLLKNIGIGTVFVVRPQVALAGHKRSFGFSNNSEYKDISIYNENEFFIHSSLHFSENFTNGSKKTFPYLIQGGSYSLNLNMQDPRSKLWNEDFYNLSIDFGGGIRFYQNRKHLFALELIYSLGINNRAFYGDNKFEETFEKAESLKLYNTIKSIHTHYLTLQILL